MIYYLVLFFLMPAFGRVDYLGYKRRMEKVLSEQPDYAENRENYQVLYDKMCAHQKRVTIAVCVLICVIALVLAALTASGALLRSA